MVERTCVECGADISGRPRHAVTCSDPCKRRRDRRSRDPEKRRQERERHRPRAERLCKHCGTAFTTVVPSHISTTGKVYCSTECHHQAKRATLSSTPCRNCGKPANRVKPYCDDRCAHRWSRRRAAQRRLNAAKKGTRGNAVWVSGVCAWCDCTYCTNQPQAAYCSRRCGSNAARARRGRFVVPSWFRSAIYERDDWTCQLCGDSVDGALPSSHPWAPTLDHIVCRSWGAKRDDSAENLRLAHRWCNSVRGDETYYTAADLVA